MGCQNKGAPLVVVLKKVFESLFDIAIGKFEGLLTIPLLIHKRKQRRLSVAGSVDLAAGVECTGLSPQYSLIGDLVGGRVIQWLVPGIS